MDQVKLVEWIKRNLLTGEGTLISSRTREEWFKRNGYSDQFCSINSLTSFLGREKGISERIFCLVNSIIQLPKCLRCKGEVQFKQYSVGYRKYCSRECSERDSHKRLSRTRETVLERYGVDNYLKTSEAQEKVRRTNLKRYGDTHTLNLSHVKKARETGSLRKYGKKNPFDSPEFQDRIKKDRFKKSGVYYVGQSHLPSNVISKLSDKEWLLHQHHSLEKSQTQIASVLGVDPTTVHRYLVDHEIDIRYYDDSSSSEGEREIYNCLKSFYSGEIIRKDRKVLSGKRELDFYLPEENFAIEFCGTYWHSSLILQDPYYHQNKTLECREQGITLFHIFSYEWEDSVKREVVKSMIRNKVGYCGSKFYARQCEIKEVTREESYNFIQTNHLQAIDKNHVGTVRLGLYRENELLAVMTFGPPRFKSKENPEWELIRFCSLKDTVIIGGASKLLSYFEREHSPASLVTYANLRYSYGNLYPLLGFSRLGKISKPNYVYTKDFKTVYSKRKFRKRNLPKILGDEFDPALSEVENCRRSGWFQVFDSGAEAYIKR